MKYSYINSELHLPGALTMLFGIFNQFFHLIIFSYGWMLKRDIERMLGLQTRVSSLTLGR